MMMGRVTALREATLRLTVIGPDHGQQAVDAVLDTGFNGFLTLPSHVVHALRLPFVGHRRATLGDGSIAVLDRTWPLCSGMRKSVRCWCCRPMEDRSWAWHCCMGVGSCCTLLMMATCSSSLGPKGCALGFAAERPGFSGGGETTPDVRVGQSILNHHCPPVRLQPVVRRTRECRQIGLQEGRGVR
jgi:hypothetical protein